ncbi:helix-turn-helix transcriptional regulator [Thalassovita sp.]|uniref:helix-turn-helix domain-containing protein n=1 Tax=Thalassovita sp. TaxID=1979401 RepID=UPI0029DE7F8A|nr:helix-turn-helix transcriptional regulator [Thalassovita sp.]
MSDEHDWYGPETATFGDRVAAAREAASMTQKQLAKRMGIKTGTLREWEQDLSEPRVNRLMMMAGILGVSMGWMLTGEGDGVSPPQDEGTVSPDVNELLLEIRDLKGQIAGTADRLGRLEKRLRIKLKGENA